MANSYLDIAEIVLRATRVPMTPSELLDRAYIMGVVPSHLHGATQEKTLQARISEDISRLRELSEFYRTDRARFFLRKFRDDPAIPEIYKTEYLARPRRKDLKNERILAARLKSDSKSKPQMHEFKAIDDLFRKGKYRYVNWEEVQSVDDLVPVYSFLVVQNEGKILTHETGKFSEPNHPTRGLKSVGFGSVVRVQDSDLLYDAYHGVIGSASNELVYSLGLPRELVRRARYGAEIHPHCGIETSRGDFGRHLLVALSYKLPAGFEFGAASLTRNRLQWQDPGSASLLRGCDEATELLIRTSKLFEMLG